MPDTERPIAEIVAEVRERVRLTHEYHARHNADMLTIMEPETLTHLCDEIERLQRDLADARDWLDNYRERLLWRGFMTDGA